MTARTRLARPEDLAALRRVEAAAGRLFAAIGMHDVAADEPPPVAVLAGYQREGRAWVSVDDDDRPVGFALADEVDGAAHLAQLSVDPAAGRQGRGRALVDEVVAWARARGLPAVTLSTFLDVPWNAPYYEACGFRRLDEEDLTPGLRAIGAAEAAHGLDPTRRVFMRRVV